VGRIGKYETHVKPYLDKIKEWKRNGATDIQICEQLDISQDTFYGYINKYPEFAEIIKNSKKEFVNELKGNLAELARKHTLTTKKTYIKNDENNKNVQTVEITEKEVDADPAAIQILLKNLDKENWADNPQSLELKRQELELRRMLAEANNFDFPREG
jgi:hypothetical protein